jgi:replication fork protection complex subunit Csm3/Swi3
MLTASPIQFSDISMLLRTYQLWLDDLYPRAKFADGLAIIEKLGHSKQLQMMRKQWIDEAKPNPFADDLEPQHAPTATNPVSDTVPPGETNGQTEAAARIDDSMDHGLPTIQTDRHIEPVKQPAEDELDQPDEDELDALLAEESFQPEDRNSSIFGNAPAQAPFASKPRAENEFADDEDALREMGEMW